MHVSQSLTASVVCTLLLSEACGALRSQRASPAAELSSHSSVVQQIGPTEMLGERKCSREAGTCCSPRTRRVPLKNTNTSYIVSTGTSPSLKFVQCGPGSMFLYVDNLCVSHFLLCWVCSVNPATWERFPPFSAACCSVKMLLWIFSCSLSSLPKQIAVPLGPNTSWGTM